MVQRVINRSRLSILMRVLSMFVFCDCCLADPLATWNLVFSNSPAPITSMAYGNGTFIGVGGGFDFISHNGSNWTVSETSPVINSGGIAFGNGMFLAFGTNNQYHANYVLQSTNGTTWTPIYTSSNTLTAAAYGNNTWVFIGTNDIATATLTSSNWNWSEYQPSFSPLCICYANGSFVIGGVWNNVDSIFSSSDAMTWQYESSVGCSSIAYGNGVFATTGGFWWGGAGSSWVYVSSNLVQWTTVITNSNYGSSESLPVAYGGGQFVVCPGTYTSGGFGGLLGVQTSSNGYTWKTNLFGGNPSYPTLNTLTYGQGTFVACDGNSIYQSGTFATVSNPPPTTLAISTYPGVTITGTPGLTYQIQYTTNLNSTWLPLATFALPYSPYIWVDTSLPILGQRFYRSVQLQ